MRHILLFLFLTNINIVSNAQKHFNKKIYSYQVDLVTQKLTAKGSLKTLNKKRFIFNQRLDTILFFGNQDSRMFFFSECFNPLFNIDIPILFYATISTNNRLNFLAPDLTNYNNSYSKDQFSVIFKINEAFYLITLPKKMKYIYRDSNKLRELKKVFLENLTDTSKYKGYELNDYFIEFNKFNLFVKKLLILDLPRDMNGNEDYLTDFALLDSNFNSKTSILKQYVFNKTSLEKKIFQINDQLDFVKIETEIFDRHLQLLRKITSVLRNVALTN